MNSFVKQFVRATLVTLAAAAASIASAADLAPDFTLKSTQGDNLRLSEHRGEVILLNFWASWCGPCRQEMPLLNSINDRYSKLGFSVIGVNVDKDSALASKLLKDIPVGFPVLLDNLSMVSATYDVSAMPTTVLIDRDGNMRYIHKGYKPGLEMTYEQQIKELIKE
jgi:thiol-disulfide isomerase/thioredoxin